jgi:hypothetical protein
MLGLSLEEVREVAKLIERAKNSGYLDEVTKAVFGRWAELDAQGAMEAAETMKPFNVRYRATEGGMETWLDKDVDAAFAYLEDHRVVVNFVSGMLAKTDPERATGIVIEGHLGDVLTRWVTDNEPEALAWIASRNETEQRTLTDTILTTLSNTQPEQAMRLANETDDLARQRKVIANALPNTIRQDPQAAVERYLDLDPQLRSSNLTQAFAASLSRVAPSIAFAMAEQLPPGDERDEFLENLKLP